MYKLDVSSLNDSVALVTVLDPSGSASGGSMYGAGNYVFRIPLVTYISDSDVIATVTIDPGSVSTVTTQKIIFATSSDAGTNTTVSSVVTGSGIFNLDTVIVNELRVGTIRQGCEITLTLPKGLYFDSDADIYVGVESGLAWNSAIPVDGYGIPGTDYTISRPDTNELIITLDNIMPSDQLRGSVYIDGLRVLSSDTSLLPDNIVMTVGGDVTAQEVLAATRATTSLSGKISSYNPKIPIIFYLMQGDQYKKIFVIQAVDDQGQVEQSFNFDGIIPGTYTLYITKFDHTSLTVKNLVIGEDGLDLSQSNSDSLNVLTLPCGDINGDGAINVNDLNILWSNLNYGKTAAAAQNPLCDLDGNGFVNVNDLNILWSAANYGKGPVTITLP